MRIHKEGYSIIIRSLLIWSIINGIVWIYGSNSLLTTILIITTPVLALCIRFFRSPRREVNFTSNILAPADGKVVVIEETDENEYFNDRRLQISIFMSPFNVHVNWIPVKVTTIRLVCLEMLFVIGVILKEVIEIEELLN